MKNFQQILFAHALTKHKKPNYNKRSQREANWITFIILLAALLCFFYAIK
mgnify:FL=1